MNRILTLIVATLALALASGCTEELEPAETAETPTDTQPAATTGGGGRSTLGKAKETAENTVSEVEQRNAELLKQLEGD